MAARRFEISLRVREVSYLQAAMQCSIYYIELFSKRLSEKVQATIPKGIQWVVLSALFSKEI